MRHRHSPQPDAQWRSSSVSLTFPRLRSCVYIKHPLNSALENGDPLHGDVLSLLPDQRLSRCTCPGESHPGPVHSDGSYVGRSAPEIDVFEATTSYTTRALGQVSQSGQWAPFDGSYQWQNTSENLIIPNSTMTQFNSYQGGAFQEVTSSLSTTNQDCYELGTGCFSVYAFEYMPGFDNAWVR